MKVLLIGVGTVGEAIAKLSAAGRGWSGWCSRTTTSTGPGGSRRQVGDPARHPVGAHRRLGCVGGRGARARARRRPGDERGRSPIPDARVRGRAGRGCRLHGHGREPVGAASHRPVPVARRQARATGSSSSRRSGSAGAGSRWSAWAWIPGSRTCSLHTLRSTCSTRSTRSTSVTAATCASRAMASPRCSPSGPPSRSASIHPSSGSGARLADHGAVRGARAVPVPRGYRAGRVRPRGARGGDPHAALASTWPRSPSSTPSARVHRGAADAPSHRASTGTLR